MQRLINNKAVSIVLLLILSLLASISGTTFSFGIGDNSLSIIKNVSPELIPDDPKIYKRAVVESMNSEITNETWASFMLYNCKLFYREALAFRLVPSATIKYKIGNETVVFSSSLTEYINHQSRTNYVYQDLSFQNSGWASDLGESKVIIPSTIANLIWDASFFEEPYSADRLCGMEILINGESKQIGAVYDVDANRQVTNNFWYRNFGNTIFLSSADYEQLTSGDKESYYFTINDDLDISTTLASNFLIFCEYLSLPRVQDNQVLNENGFEIYDIATKIWDSKNSPSSIALTIFSFVVLVASITCYFGLILLSLFKNRTPVLIICSLLFAACPILVFAVCNTTISCVAIGDVFLLTVTRITPWILLALSLLLLIPMAIKLLQMDRQPAISKFLCRKKFSIKTRVIKI